MTSICASVDSWSTRDRCVTFRDQAEVKIFRANDLALTTTYRIPVPRRSIIHRRPFAPLLGVLCSFAVIFGFILKISIDRNDAHMGSQNSRQKERVRVWLTEVSASDQSSGSEAGMADSTAIESGRWSAARGTSSKAEKPAEPLPSGRNVRILANRTTDEDPAYIRENFASIAQRLFDRDSHHRDTLRVLIELISAEKRAGNKRRDVVVKAQDLLLQFLPGTVRFVANFSATLVDMVVAGWNPLSGQEEKPRGGGSSASPAAPDAPPAVSAMGYSPFTYSWVPAPGMPPTAPQPYYVSPCPYPAYPPQPPPASKGKSTPPTPNPETPAATPESPAAGEGVPTGFSYFFPREHVRIFVLRCSRPPWQLPTGAQIGITANYVPTSVTVGELMQGFGCRSADPSKNRVVECCPGGGGSWYKGVSVAGDAKDTVQKQIRELGWDETRGTMINDEERPGVFLWFCK